MTDRHEPLLRMHRADAADRHLCNRKTLICCFIGFGIAAFLILGGVEIISKGCSGEPRPWNSMIPAKTMMQMEFFQTWHRAVDVYGERDHDDDDDTSGYWEDYIFISRNKYAFVQDGSTILVAWRPWGTIFGILADGYNIERCGDDAHGYLIQEDYWARPWINVNSQKTFNIKESNTGRIVAKSQHSVANWAAPSLFQHWTSSIKKPTGEVIASIQQDSRYTDWFQLTRQKWYTENKRPDLLPNEIVSFLAAFYDIKEVRKEEEEEEEGEEEDEEDD
eukprot:gnl/TRDRNA2_/TRDRNA2_151870_c2_seq1.p1 gnl/TRDRNA2_/TRDRNA2_151870_c2~~gnl/TRDRNA2_/TRDRNA2_151870_c2_seq1.p1  ORF type:complete len:277 (+),score=29.25 gnl/TRDRNA2_/TRDRNA2_151870_c2_seq1:42-872(+)